MDTSFNRLREKKTQGVDIHNLALDYGHYVNRITNKSLFGN